MGRDDDRIHPSKSLGSYIVRRNVSGFLDIRFRRSATRHRVSRSRSLFVIRRAEWALALPLPEGAPDRDPRLLRLDEDWDGVALEVIAVEPEPGLLVVIHSMPLRDRYRAAWEEIRRWAE